MAIIEGYSYLLTAFLFRIQYSFTFYLIRGHGFFCYNINTHVQCFHNKFIMCSIYRCYNNIIWFCLPQHLFKVAEGWTIYTHQFLYMFQPAGVYIRQTDKLSYLAKSFNDLSPPQA